MGMHSCATCRFWRRDNPDDVTIGDCRRYPPVIEPGRTLLHVLRLFREADIAGDFDTPFVHGKDPDKLFALEWSRDVDNYVTYPETYSDDWCGEYQPEPQETA